MKTLPLALLSLVAVPACVAPTTPPYLQEARSPQEILERMVELATPGPEHAVLNALVGTFEAEVTTWTTPDEPPTRANGSIVNEWILGERFLVGEYSGEFLGQPLEGFSILGYDRSQEMYFGTWADTASTWFMPFSGGHREGNTITLYRETYDQTLGTMTRMRESIRIDSRDRHTIVSYYTLPGGREVKASEIVYRRIE